MNLTPDNDTLVTLVDPNDNIIPVTVEPQEVDADNVFIEIAAPGLITGSVFQDFDADQIPDTGEGLEGVVLSLYTDTDANGIPDANGFVSDTFTSGIGYYTFINVVPANYVIVETNPANDQSIMDIDASNDGDLVPNTNIHNDTIPVTVGNAETDANNYFIESIACSTGGDQYFG